MSIDYQTQGEEEMGPEEKCDEAVEEHEAETIHGMIMRRRKEMRQRLSTTTDRFLGTAETVDAAVIVPNYYAGLLTWALHRYTQAAGWRIVNTLGYHGPKPTYIDVDTGCGERQNLLRDGLLLLEKGDTRLVIALDVNLRTSSSAVANGPAPMAGEVRAFADGLSSIAKAQNFYRGGKLEFSGRIRFLNLADRSWESAILDQEIKQSIRANTIGFLANRERLRGYGIPAKRGVLLAGDPGTGKTLICKALMAESSDITCIMANAYALADDEYITDLYELAQDLSPCIVFIEDIDLIARDRVACGYSGAPALLSLLSVLDGVEEHDDIVTVATTNHLGILDKAIGHRPSRFDRVIALPRPSLERRRELIESLCQKVPLGETTRDYIARRADHCTPAQLQEIVYGLVIEHVDGRSDAGVARLDFSHEHIDGMISKVGGRNERLMGFRSGDNDNGARSGKLGALGLQDTSR